MLLRNYFGIGYGLIGILLVGCGGSTSGDNTTTQMSNTPPSVRYDTTTKEEMVLSYEQLEIVELHNQKRRMYYTDSDLSYSQELEAAAQEYANRLAQSGDFRHDPNNQIFGYGENLYAHSSSSLPEIDEVLNSWFDEEEPYYNYDDGSCKEGTFDNGLPILCGHYTQVLWQETREVGCASAQYQAGDFKNGYVYVCKYKKAGNVSGEKPYCLEYSNADLYTKNRSSFLDISLEGKTFPIELFSEDRTKCTRISSMNSAIELGKDFNTIQIKEFKIFNTDTASVTLEFDSLLISKDMLKLTGKNRHIADKNYQDKDIYMNIKIIGETSTYYGVEIDWNGYDATQKQYSRQMRAKLYK